tara:strand:+ start:1299 stop:1460 length:162 start_codon:yes stop_codon:yes gene_type:complete
MKWPNIETIREWRESGKMRLKDIKFWENDKTQNVHWLSIVLDRLEKENEKTKS